MCFTVYSTPNIYAKYKLLDKILKTSVLAKKEYKNYSLKIPIVAISCCPDGNIKIHQIVRIIGLRFTQIPLDASTA